MEQTNSDNYLDKLMETARKDGIVTDHEKQMIKQIMERISDYNKILEQALSDDIITSDEKINLYKFRTNIFIENMKFVNEDKIKAILDENRASGKGKKKSKFQQRLETAMKASEATKKGKK